MQQDGETKYGLWENGRRIKWVTEDTEITYAKKEILESKRVKKTAET